MWQSVLTTQQTPDPFVQIAQTMPVQNGMQPAPHQPKPTCKLLHCLSRHEGQDTGKYHFHTALRLCKKWHTERSQQNLDQCIGIHVPKRSDDRMPKNGSVQEQEVQGSLSVRGLAHHAWDHQTRRIGNWRRGSDNIGESLVSNK